MTTERNWSSRLARLGMAALFWGAAAMANADVLVIGNAAVNIDKLSVSDVRDLYLGKAVQLPDGGRAEVIDLFSGHPVREEFYEKVIGKDASQIKAYWAKRIFTGKGAPPDSRRTEEAVVRWVADKPGRVGYVSPSADTSSVKVLLRTD